MEKLTFRGGIYIILSFFYTQIERRIDMNWYQIACLVGIPTIGATVMTYLLVKVRHTVAETKALRKGVQALLRDRLYQCFYECSEKGEASIDERNNFMNMYEQYHSLWENGVMDDIKMRFLALPVETEKGDE